MIPTIRYSEKGKTKVKKKSVDPRIMPGEGSIRYFQGSETILYETDDRHTTFNCENQHL